ncbi:MAG: hypothetical protein NUV94_06580 [Candidatus Acetothermia bacterium]|jgi:hypothetical protein|nr:hypothetical protein [Candidatus Acetothermia bacterium]
MPYLLVLMAALLILPAFGLGVVTLALVLTAGVAVLVAALALGATGSLLDWILAAVAMGVSWRAFQAGRRLLRRLRTALATAGPGIGRPRPG